MNKNELRGRIIAKGYNTEEFCKRIGMTRVTFDRRMNGKSEFTRDEIERITTALDMSVNDMYSIFFAKFVA